MFNIFKDYIDRLINSEFGKRIKGAINSFVDTFASSGLKDKVDNFINSEETSENNNTVYSGLNKRVSKFIRNKLGGRIKSTKILNMIGKIVSIILALGFAALVIYMMIKLLPSILMMIAMIFAVMVTIELVIAILNRAVKPIKN